MSLPRHEVVRASAGTGKTHALVERYLWLVGEGGLRPGAVVAITFTRKAALELKGRIRARLAGAAVPAEVLAELARAPVNNFHGLALQLLTDGGGVGEALRVLGEDGDDRRLFVTACEEAWLADASLVATDVAALARRVSVDAELPGALWEALARAREDGRAVSGELVAAADAETVRQACAPALEALRARLAAALPGLSRAARDRVEPCLRLAPAAASGSPREWAEAWSAAAAGLSRLGKLGELVDEATLKLAKGGLVDLVRGELACEEARPHLARLLEAAYARYLDLKRELEAVDFGDLLERVVARLETDAGLHRRVRERCRAVLVDEAQDTNRLQRRFVHLLAGLSGPAAAAGPPASLFIVGDRKQAIYTFRGADPESFEAFVDDVGRLGGVEQTLETSWRASPRLCDGINHLGRHLFGGAYEPIRPAPAVAREGAGFCWIETPAGSDAAASALAEAAAAAAHVRGRLARGERAGDVVLLLSALGRAPLYIAALTDAGVPATLGGGGALYAEPHVLALAALLDWIAFREDRMAAATALRSSLFGVSESALVELFGPGSAVAFAKLCQGELDPTVAGGGDEAALRLALAVMPRLWRLVDRLPPQDLLREAMEALDYEAVLAALPAGSRRVADVRALCAAAERFAATVIPDSRRFARELRLRIENGGREPLAARGAPDAVRVGTVHQAKGLEFPVVLLADLAHGGRGERGPVRYARARGLVLRPRVEGEAAAGLGWREADADARAAARGETARLLYVAVTRAEREVIFFAPAYENPPRRGFLELLGPWRGAAVAAGVLTAATAPPPDDRAAPPGPLAAATSESRAAAESALDRLTAAPLADGARLALGVTQLEAYLGCLRRGALRFQLGVEEPDEGHGPHPAWEDLDPPLDPLTRGRLAHAVLARLDSLGPQGEAEPFVRASLAALGYDPGDERLGDTLADLTRFLGSPLGRIISAVPSSGRRHELPFTFGVDAEPFTLVVSGQMDLLYWDGEGPVVLDFKHARPSAAAIAAHRLQLETYAVAAARLCGVAGAIRTQLVFLRGPGRVVAGAVSPEARAALVSRLAGLARELGGAHRARSPWPVQPIERCRELGCGFVTGCHPGSPPPRRASP